MKRWTLRKTAAQNSNLLRIGLIASTLVAIAASPGCGKPADSDTTGDENAIKVSGGRGGIGSQCSFGSQGTINPVDLHLFNCPVNLEEAQLTQAPVPLYFQADCYKKLLAVRAADRSFDSQWEIMPDGTFDVVIGGDSVKYVNERGRLVGLANDGNGTANCTTPVEIEVMGRVACSDDPAKRDKATINVEILWWLGKGKPLSREAGTQCRMPTANRGCYLYTKSRLNQC